MNDYSSSPSARPGERLRNFVDTLRHNLTFALFGGVVGYMMGFILLPVSGSLAASLAGAVHGKLSPGTLAGVHYLTLGLSAVGCAYAGAAFSALTKRPQEIEDPEAELEAALEEDRQSWSDFRD